MKKISKLVLSFLWITLLSISLSSCSDYGYEFHFAVINGNGNLTIDLPASEIENLGIELCSNPGHPYELDCPEGSQWFYILGGRNGSYEFTFIAEPDEGYEVKQWLFNNEIVVGNTSNSFLAEVSSETSRQGFIFVEFALI